jgi:ABC-type nitrate/sulfonate/bicarbonate transport system substrate-binding protein
VEGKTMNGFRGLWLALLAVTLLSACAPGPSPTGERSTAATAVPPAAGHSEAPRPGQVAPAAAAAVTPLSPPVRVRVGHLLTFAFAPFVVADARGYFAEEGLEMDYATFDSGARMVAPLAAGQLDVGQGSHSAGLFNALTSGVNLRIVSDNGMAIPGRNGSQIVARRSLVDDGFRGAETLRGRSVAFTASGSTVHINVARFLDLHGVRPDEVRLLEMGFADMNAALSNGALDFAAQTEPYITMGSEQGYLARLIGVAEYYPDRQVSVLMYASTFIEQQREAARRFMVGYLRGVRAYEDAVAKNVDRAAVLDILVDRLPVKDRSLYDRMTANGTMLYLNPDGYAQTDSIAWDHDWLIQQGLAHTPVDLSRVIDHQFVDYAVGRLGRYPN